MAEINLRLSCIVTEWSKKCPLCSCLLLYAPDFYFSYINLGAKDLHCTMLLPTAITSACLLLWDQEPVWTTLMKEDAHPCTMQLHQTQMASKYHVVRMKDRWARRITSAWLFLLQIYVSFLNLLVLSFLKSLEWEIDWFHNYSLIIVIFIYFNIIITFLLTEMIKER